MKIIIKPQNPDELNIKIEDIVVDNYEEAFEIIKLIEATRQRQKIEDRFSYFINNVELYMEEKKEWDLMAGKKYFNIIKDDLLDCLSLDDVEVTIHNSTMPESCKTKIFATIKDIYLQKMKKCLNQTKIEDIKIYARNKKVN